MSDPDDTVRYARLRDTAIRVLDALGTAEADPETLRNALVDLHLTVDDSPAVTPFPHAPQDPARHLRSRLKYEGDAATPVPLEEEATDLNRQLAADRGERGVRLTELQGMIIGNLLQELAARVRPGAAFGPSRHGESLAETATDLSWRLLDQTFVGRG
ncbi:hypothetical protein [Nocardia terpenica]|uniref:Uncharacterized protein n=1 Tax=Nocardia terpenica TaxID=455432 RepID=A0A6G9YXG2_9NOCA|nr:hypothetical protein [Nocardia terpenica]QIS17791.1 hypothetical protein F6W96_05165 [Nocardia terpenica]